MIDYDFNVCVTNHRIIPTRNPVTVAENDHNSDVLKIRLPRQIGLIDVLAASHVLISWQAEGSSGIVEIDTDYICFEGEDHIILLWSPDNSITSYNGVITFDLTIRNVGSENVITQNWSAAGGALLCLATIDAESKLYEDMISQYDEVLTAMTKGPIIRDNYWWTYNWDHKLYENTGVAASGNPGPAGEPGERGPAGEPGPAGADGKTPERGVDYWTDDDKTEILSESTKPPVIRYGNWYTYDTITKDYADTGVSATGPAGQDGQPGERGETGEAGPAGKDGHTPIRGTDYWTDDDKTEILSESTKPPVIRDGNWFTYDTTTKDYIDTGISATGPAGQDGKNGVDGQPGERGPAGEPGEIGERGPAGQDGHTPIRGTDYWTAEDQSAIITEILTHFIDAEAKSY